MIHRCPSRLLPTCSTHPEKLDLLTVASHAASNGVRLAGGRGFLTCVVAVALSAGSACSKQDTPISCPDGTGYRQAKIEGLVTAVCIDSAQRLHGPALSWHDAQHTQKKLVGSYLEGLPDGEFEQYSAEGAQLGSYQMSQGTGVRIRWFEDGTTAEETGYQAGKKSGRATTWYQGGIKREEGEFRAGNRVGTWRSWDPEGKELAPEHYDDDGNKLSSAPTGAAPAAVEKPAGSPTQ